MYNLFDDNIPVELCGTKARNLQVLSKKGVRVPKGVLLSIPHYYVYKKYKSANIARDEVKELMSEGLRSVWKEVERIIQKPVILRSSTCEEDGNASSYAGIYSSSHPVSEYGNFVDALFDVWDSYDSFHAKRYRCDSGQVDLGMAVIVQAWVSPKIRGVMFSCDPRNGEEYILIEYALCKGEEELKQYTYRVCVRGKSVSVECGDCDAVDVKLMKCLCECAKRIYAIFGHHVDIEWIYADKLYIVQVRPVTVIGQTNDEQYSFNAYGSSVNGCLIDRYSQPATPAYLSLLECWQDRVYLDMHSNKIGVDINTKPLLFFFNRVYWNLDYQAEQYNTPYRSLEELKTHDCYLYDLIINGASRWYARLDVYQKELAKIDSINLSELSDCELKEYLLNLLSVFCDGIGIEHYQMLGVANICYMLLQHMLESRLNSSVKAIDLIHSGRGNKTTESNNELYDIAKYICSIPTLRERIAYEPVENIYMVISKSAEYRDVFEKIHMFLQRHGHRGTGCDDLYYPHWSDEPILLMKVLMQYCQLILGEGKEHNNDYMRIDGSVCLSEELQEMAELASKYMNLREDQRYYFDMSWIIIRKTYLEIGARMVIAGEIDSSDDIFFTHYDEMIQMLNGSNHVIDRKRIRLRKQQYLNSQIIDPPFLLKGGKVIRVQKRGKYKNYKVTVVSTGYALGIARCVLSADELQNVQQGEILIVPTFHPAWTPVLGVAGGIVMGYGNILSHGAIVAREYGVPAVIYNGTTDGQLYDGMLIELDAYQGRLRIMSECNK